MWPRTVVAVSRAVAIVWGVGAIAALLVFVVVRLGQIAWEAIAGGMSVTAWLLLLANCAFLAYAEGYRGFQLRFSPRVAARALYLAQQPSPLRVALAPLFCTGYFEASPRVLRTTWVGTALIIFLVIVVQRLPQPWRGVVDAGVVVGIGWGVVSLIIATARTFAERRFLISPELPAGASL